MIMPKLWSIKVLYLTHGTSLLYTINFVTNKREREKVLALTMPFYIYIAE